MLHCALDAKLSVPQQAHSHPLSEEAEGGVEEAEPKKNPPGIVGDVEEFADVPKELPLVGGCVANPFVTPLENEGNEEAVGDEPKENLVVPLIDDPKEFPLVGDCVVVTEDEDERGEEDEVLKENLPIVGAMLAVELLL